MLTVFLAPREASMTAPHLVIVDDDREIRTLLTEQLSDAGYRVSAASDGPELRQLLANARADLIVLDLNLPGEDGLSICRRLRETSSMPVIMLTARGEPQDRIAGLELGADDYLAKPFEPRELVARIKNVLRRARSLPSNLERLAAKQAEFSGWVLDFERRHLLDPSGRAILLSGAEYRLLTVFVEHANRVLSREQLIGLGAIRQEDVSDRAVDLQVSRLRQKMARAELIRTVRNEGYVLASPVALS